MKYMKLLLLVLGAMFLACSTTPVVPLPYRGTNLDGGQFGTVYPGREGTDYSWPTTQDVDYFASKNMTAFRIGFQWERLQPTLNGPFDPAYFAKLDALVKYASAKGLNVFLNPHNFARYRLNGVETVVGTTALPNTAFANLWSRLGAQYKDNPRVHASLVNEPHDMPTRQWVGAANAAIAAIRLTGNRNVISVPGNAYTSAEFWSSSWSPAYDVSSAVAMLEIVDPANNVIFEVHNYFDPDGSGTYKQDCASTTAGSKKLLNVTAWARTNKKKVIIGEVGTIVTPNCQASVKDMMDYIHANPDVYVGWLWWSAGTPWGTTYQLSINPKNGVDDTRMAWLTPYLPKAGTVDAAPPVDASPSVDAAPPVASPSFPTNPMTVTKDTVFTTVSGGITNWAFVPKTYDSTHQTPTQLFVWLHGCGGQSEWDAHMVSFMPDQKWISLAPGGREKACWSNYTTDGPKILAAIADMKTRFNIDPYRVVLGGYSSGGDIGYELAFKNANLFSGLIFENTNPSAAALTASTTAGWKLNIAHLAHTGDTVAYYAIDKVRANMNTLKTRGFPVTLIEKPGNHWDADNGTTGTAYDLRTFLLPFLNAGWLAPGAPVPPPAACVYTYSDWGVCQSNNTQTRTVTGSAPVPCTASAQVLSQACTFVPPPVDSGVVDAGTLLPLKQNVRITYNWGSGYCEEIDIVNKNLKGSLTWSSFQLNLRGGTIRDQDKKGPPWDTWNATFSARTGVITISAATWNKTVLPNTKATVGYCADFGPLKWTGTLVTGSLKP